MCFKRIDVVSCETGVQCFFVFVFCHFLADNFDLKLSLRLKRNLAFEKLPEKELICMSGIMI